MRLLDLLAKVGLGFLIGAVIVKSDVTKAVARAARDHEYRMAQLEKENE